MSVCLHQLCEPGVTLLTLMYNFPNNKTHPFHIPSSQDCWDKLGGLIYFKF